MKHFSNAYNIPLTTFYKRLILSTLYFLIAIFLFPFNSSAHSTHRFKLTLHERNNYYPFGLRTDQGRAYPTLSDRYKVKVPRLTQGPGGTTSQTGYNSTQPYTLQYNGKELQLFANTNLIDYGARQYNPILARWLSQDQMAEKYYGISPYAYCYNNPIVFIDPNGREVNAVFSKSTAPKIELNKRYANKLKMKSIHKEYVRDINNIMLYNSQDALTGDSKEIFRLSKPNKNDHIEPYSN